jgi:hypothetical protein
LVFKGISGFIFFLVFLFFVDTKLQGEKGQASGVSMKGGKWEAKASA